MKNPQDLKETYQKLKNDFKFKMYQIETTKSFADALAKNIKKYKKTEDHFKTAEEVDLRNDYHITATTVEQHAKEAIDIAAKINPGSKLSKGLISQVKHALEKQEI